MNLRNSFFSFLKKTILFLSCLAITAILFAVLIILILYKSFINRSTVLDIVRPKDKVEQSEKIIKSKIYLFADIENDLDSTKNAIMQISEDNSSYEGYTENVMDDISVIVLGDITSLGVLTDLEDAKVELDKLPFEYYVVPGDRDLWKTNGLENFTSVFGKSYSVENVNDSKLLFIDNSDEYDGISDEQFKFIRDNIADTDFVFLHNPIFFGDTFIKKLFRKGMGQYSGKVDAQRIELLKIIRNSNVKAVFAGDQHVYSESVDDVRDSLKHFVVGALNATRSVGGSSYAILTVYEDKSYSVVNRALSN